MTATCTQTLPRRSSSASSMRLLPVPATEPPFDDERGAQAATGVPGRAAHSRLGHGASGGRHVGTGGQQGSCHGPTALVDRTPRRLTVPDQLHADSGRPVHPSTGSPPAGGQRPRADGRRIAPPGQAAVIVVRAIVEALGGIRPVSHLANWTTPRLQSDLERTAAQFGRRRTQVRSVRVSEPRPGVAEVSAVINRGTRVAALALRMESASGRWRVTTLQVG
ncbi:Rv3235 family protein [Frankia sp. AgB32]|uniref:Rv3235 family protein n=1 Tax=Frankia sp. AgB32 TaxID=631119 RepID=UPI00200BEAE9|nr:Rv3235 family protein [Frankia sp. AgB32]MCK9896828.1 Rv3235 family protein [Frankia sp. AgB32]